MNPPSLEPRVTIGLPTYNSEKFLDQAINSIRAQTYRNFLLLINDDASKDRTDQICRLHAEKDPRIRYTRNNSNRGGAINYQHVFRAATSEYFRWAAHDDMLAPELLEKCIAVLDRRPDVVLCYPRAISIDENGEVIGEYDDHFDFQSPVPHRRFGELLSRMYGHDGNPMFGVIRRNVMEKTALIAPFPSSDMTFLAELVLYGKFCEVPERLYFHRIHPGVSSRLGLTASEYTAWHDRSRAGRLAFPRLLRMKALIVAVSHAPITPYNRARCYLSIGRYYLSPAKGAKFLRQILLHVKKKR